MSKSGISNADNLIGNAEIIYKYAIKPNRDIAEKYGVGFAIMEFGVFGGKNMGDIAYQYVKDMRKMFEKHALGYCYCEMDILGISRFIPYFVQVDSRVDIQTYTYEDKPSQKFYICRDMLQVMK